MVEGYKTYSKSSIKEVFISLVFYLIWPISSLAISIALYKKSWSKYFFILFGFYFGFSFIVPSSKTTEAYDSEFYAVQLKEYHFNDITFRELVNGFYSIETGQTDIYQPIVTWGVSVFTDNYHVLFAVYGLVFSLFLAKITWLMIKMANVEQKGFAIYILLTFVLINPLWNINGVRMWTALNVFLYGVIVFYFKNRTKGVIFILLSCLVHVSFVIPVLFFFVSLCISKIKISHFFLLFIISFLFKGLPPTMLTSLSAFLPEFIRYKLDFYTDPNTVSLVAENAENTSLFILASQFSQSFIRFLLLIYMYIFYKKQIVDNKKQLFFYKYLLLTICWVNMTAIIPSFGRFQSISLMLSMFFFLINLSFLNKLAYFNFLKFALFPFFILIIVQKLREFIDFQGVYLFVGNFLTYVFVSSPEPLVNFLLK
jgi:hypothetical protein